MKSETAPSETTYWEDGKALAISSLGIRLTDAGQVRDWISKYVQPYGMLSTTVADFWLRIPKPKGQERRLELDPPSPFTYPGPNNAMQGQRVRIEEWHEAWNKRVGVEARYKELEDKHDPVSRRIRAELERDQPYLVLNSRKSKRRYIVGWAEGITPGLMDRAFTDPDTLDLEDLSIAAALQRPWFDRDEQAMWLEILRSLQDQAIDEQKREYDERYSELKRQVLQGWVEPPGQSQDF
ncbi:hypothetical protein [Thauera sp. Sel9]|uniref:hypothetical protein n=1 Tax=Thauera sp. Sel9 TaxID=2974299 RepID=UPI0021E1052A|nr:hypothetical protein [Thauera sp. Sel9]MCV2216100.1 hypothetical protein [Thauera sp. Sel9]